MKWRKEREGGRSGSPPLAGFALQTGLRTRSPPLVGPPERDRDLHQALSRASPFPRKHLPFKPEPSFVLYLSIHSCQAQSSCPNALDTTHRTRPIRLRVVPSHLARDSFARERRARLRRSSRKMGKTQLQSSRVCPSLTTGS